jgi:tagaturonate reductase
MEKLTRSNFNIPERPIKVLQFGEGNFLRGFVDWMIDLMNKNTDFNGDVQVVQPLTEGLGTQINEQEGLFHVKLQGIQSGKIYSGK